jgi:hypothetical protein
MAFEMDAQAHSPRYPEASTAGYRAPRNSSRRACLMGFLQDKPEVRFSRLAFCPLWIPCFDVPGVMHTQKGTNRADRIDEGYQEVVNAVQLVI